MPKEECSNGWRYSLEPKKPKLITSDFSLTQRTAHSFEGEHILSDEEQNNDYVGLGSCDYVGRAGRPIKRREAEHDRVPKILNPMSPSSAKRRLGAWQPCYETACKRSALEDDPTLNNGDLPNDDPRPATVEGLKVSNAKYIYPSEGCYELVTAGGGRLFLPKKGSVPGASSAESALTRDTRHLYHLVVEIEKELKESEENQSLPDTGNFQMEVDPCQNSSKEAKKNVLWSDMYTPQWYVDLVGDEALNREVFGWVKSWDACRVKHTNKNEDFPAFTSTSTDESRIDSLKRPDKKILIINGPPTSGKTTLSKVTIKQAGYRLVEIDAMDEGSSITLKDKLINAQENRTLFAPKKPNAVLVEDIDKISQASSEAHDLMQAILDYATDSNSENNRKLARKRVQTAPIICTATNLYAPCLGRLRKVSHVVSIKKPSSVSIINRLHEICNWQLLHADYQALSALCELSDCDIRSCINILQFIKSRTSVLDVKTFEHLSSAVCHRNKFENHVWNICKRVFSRSQHKLMSGANSGYGGVFLDIYNEISSFGDLDKLFLCCFGSYLRAKNIYFGGKRIGLSVMSTPRLEFALEFIEFYDLVETQIKIHMSYDLIPYLMSAISSFNILFAAPPLFVKLDYTNADLASRQMETRVKGILASFKELINSSASRSVVLDKKRLMMDMIPYIIDIITPELILGTVDLFSGVKDAKLEYLANVMLSIGLQWVQRPEPSDTSKGIRQKNISHSNNANFYLEPSVLLVRTLKSNSNMSVIAP